MTGGGGLVTAAPGTKLGMQSLTSALERAIANSRSVSACMSVCLSVCPSARPSIRHTRGPRLRS